MTERWARFDTESNALDNVEKLSHFLERAKHHPEEWKWVVICCFSALYSYAIQVAKGTDDLSVIVETKKGHKKLISFGEALKRCEKPFGGRDVLKLSAEESESIRVIQNEFRNKFEHYNPGSWAIEISGFPEHILNCLAVIQRLAIDMNFYTHLSLLQKERLELTLKSCELSISEIREE